MSAEPNEVFMTPAEEAALAVLTRHQETYCRNQDLVTLGCTCGTWTWRFIVSADNAEMESQHAQHRLEAARSEGPEIERAVRLDMAVVVKLGWPAPETPHAPAESSPEPPAGPERGTGEAGPETSAQRDIDCCADAASIAPMDIHRRSQLMTASDTPPPLTDEELQQYRDLIDMHRQYGPALSIEGEARLLAEVDRLRAMKCAACGKRIGYLNYKGHLLGWGCADGEECDQGRPHRFDTERGEVLVEDSWFKVDDLPDILGNFMRASAEHGREAKRYAMEIARLRAALGETGGTDAELRRPP